jgi:Ser/Thr protein kinase RdoA (MazF antagonist)
MILLKRKQTNYTHMKPQDVLHNWDIPGFDNKNLELRKPESGLLNKTFLIRAGENGNELFVLQNVHPAVSMDGAMHNYFHVTQFLKEQGLITQTLIPTNTGALWIEDEDTWRWRLLAGVEGQIFNESKDTELAIEAGKQLAEFHNIISQYPKELETGRLSFRYENEIAKLNQFQEQLMSDDDESIRDATKLLLEELPKLALPEDLPKKIIHADPKISNFVFDANKRAVCMIDLDTVQVLSPLYDLGDALRSWCGQKEDAGDNHFNVEIYEALLKGYLSNSKGFLSEREQSLIPQAAKLIMLGLACRFLNDYIEDSYFGWDETKYESRKAHNKARTLGQISLYQSALKVF